MNTIREIRSEKEASLPNEENSEEKLLWMMIDGQPDDGNHCVVFRREDVEKCQPDGRGRFTVATRQHSRLNYKITGKSHWIFWPRFPNIGTAFVGPRRLAQVPGDGISRENRCCS